MTMPSCDLVAWTAGHGWTEWHILDNAHTTCGRRIPWMTGSWRVVDATMDRLDSTCRSCRELTADRLARVQ